MEINFVAECLMYGAAVLAGMAITKMPEGYKPPVQPVDWDGAKARFRAEHNVRAIDEEESGKPVESVSNGVYGFTYSAGFGTPSPLFSKPSFQAFEYHRLPDGEIAVLGCVRQQDADKLQAGEFVSLRLYPEPYDDAIVPTVIYFRHILRSNNRMSRANGNFIEFDVKRED